MSGDQFDQLLKAVEEVKQGLRWVGLALFVVFASIWLAAILVAGTPHPS